MTTKEAKSYRDEIAAGRARFAELCPLFEPEHARQFIVIDAVSGDYAIDANPAAARHRLLARRPDARPFEKLIGRPAAFKMRGPRRSDKGRCGFPLSRE